MAEKRLNVFPSRMVLQSIRERSVAAKKGYDLLKRKSDAIKLNLNTKLKEILIVKRRVGELLREASYEHAQAEFSSGKFNDQVIEATKDASFKLKLSIQNVAGVRLPRFERLKDDGGPREMMIGLSTGGEAVSKYRTLMAQAMDEIIKLASLQTSVRALDEALKVTNRRVNALEFVIMPQLANTIRYINSELDELEREDNYRIKKVKDIRARTVEIYTDDDAPAGLTEPADVLKMREELEKKAEAAPSVLAPVGEEPSLDISDVLLGSGAAKKPDEGAAATRDERPKDDSSGIDISAFV